MKPFHPTRRDMELLMEGMALRARLREQLLFEDLVWIVPAGMLDDVTAAYGLQVHHVEGVTSAYLAHPIGGGA